MNASGRFRILLAWLTVLNSGCTSNSQPQAPDVNEGEDPFSGPVTWVSSAGPQAGRFRIARTTSNGRTSEITYLTDSAYSDYKPVISPDGSRIAFFRAYSQPADVNRWETSICVMNSDGSDLRELTDHDYMNSEPYWARDGSNRITWTRTIHAADGRQGRYVYWTASDAQPGDERQISATDAEFSNSNLQDGRIIVSRGGYYTLMTPNPGGEPSYEMIGYPDSHHILHKGTVSNDETMIAYMKWDPAGTDPYMQAELVLADFDASIPAIANEFTFVPKNESKLSWYPGISPDNQLLIYAEDGKIMLYDVGARRTRQISTMNHVYYAYPTFLGSVK
jgi:Tol biopolymer transport system component